LAPKPSEKKARGRAHGVARGPRAPVKPALPSEAGPADPFGVYWRMRLERTLEPYALTPAALQQLVFPAWMSPMLACLLVRALRGSDARPRGYAAGLATAPLWQTFARVIAWVEQGEIEERLGVLGTVLSASPSTVEQKAALLALL
jgi:hypothetical protein